MAKTTVKKTAIAADASTGEELKSTAETAPEPKAEAAPGETAAPAKAAGKKESAPAPAWPDGVDPAKLAAKMKAGLTREQAVQILKEQAAHDARRAAVTTK